MYNKASADGTAIGIAAPTLPLDERLGSLGDRVRPSLLSWVGRVNTVDLIIFVRSDSLGSIKDAFAKVATLSATGVGSALTIYPHALNAIVGTRFKLILGYKGSADGMLAVDRNEVNGHCTGWDTFKASHLDWLKSGKIRILVQFALHRHPELPDVPTAIELARTTRQAALMKAVVSASEIGMSFYMPPRVPAERLSELQTAFDKCMKDPAFMADLKKLNLGLDPLSGQAVSELVTEVKNIPDDLIPDLKRAYSVAK
jgi:tripartite-type tricarboxylate transporter receptor subunit TctC